MATPTDIAESAVPRTPAGRPGGRVAHRRYNAAAYVFIVGYGVLAVLFGVVPAIYTLILAFTSPGGSSVSFKNFTQVFQDFRFVPALEHVALYLIIWLIGLVIFVPLLALVAHSVRLRWASGAVRLLFYLPGALAGAGSVVLWLFVLDPATSPVSLLLRPFGFHEFVQVIAPSHLPLIFAVIAFWTGAGGWILILFGALNNISLEVMEAARVDGANSIQIAWHIQLPLLRKWLSYMGVLTLAAGLQLFVEPQLLSQASDQIVPNDYSLNQLAYAYAFAQNNFNGAAALSIILLVVALGLSTIFILRGGLFERG